MPRRGRRGPDRPRAKSTSIGHLSPTTRTAPSHGTRELPTASFPARTFTHGRDSDATLWCGAADTPGERATVEAYHKLSRSCLRVEDGFTRPLHVAEGIVENKVRVLNVAGHRESEAPGSGARSHSRIVARPPTRGQPSGRPPTVLRRHRATERTDLWQVTQHSVSRKSSSVAPSMVRFRASRVRSSLRRG
ncbi:MAG: hypothetical protein JO116_05120, partial [Planctomycetaceae bacterium]|nr:hypothetical protein [Planctomycetaceae bacterium]